jgi:ribosomal protein L1
MNKIVNYSIMLLTVTALFICCKKSDASEETLDYQATSDTVSSSAAVEKEGSTRKFIRTADLKFKVKNVTKSTYAIENITNKFDGFVTYTNLQSTIVDKF